MVWCLAKEKEKNRLIGCHVMESQTADVEQQFDGFVQKLSNASASDSAPQDDQAWATSMSEASTPNREHLVHCAKARQHCVITCFVAAACNLPYPQAFHVSVTRLMTSRWFWNRTVLSRPLSMLTMLKQTRVASNHNWT
jgi:hypothetical protein